METADLTLQRKQKPEAPIRSRLQWLDVAKGFAIITVVIGHALGGMIDAHSNSWLGYGFLTIYTFHMPLFFLLSGMLVSSRLGRAPDRFRRSLLLKIAFPYFLWATIQMLVIAAIGKLANHPMQVIGPVRVLELFWVPASQFWFLYALFWMHAFSLVFVPRCNVWSLVLVAFALKIGLELAELVGVPSGGIYGHMVAFFPYYVLGVALGVSDKPYRVLDRLTPLQVCLLAGLTCVTMLWTILTITQAHDPTWIATSSAGILDRASNGLGVICIALAMTSLVILLARRDWFAGLRPLQYLGRMTMPIFVLHIMAVAGLRIVCTRLFGYDHDLALLPVLAIAGLAFPVAAFEILRRLRLAAPLGLE